METDGRMSSSSSSSSYREIHGPQHLPPFLQQQQQPVPYHGFVRDGGQSQQEYSRPFAGTECWQLDGGGNEDVQRVPPPSQPRYQLQTATHRRRGSDPDDFDASSHKSRNSVSSSGAASHPSVPSASSSAAGLPPRTPSSENLRSGPPSVSSARSGGSGGGRDGEGNRRRGQSPARRGGGGAWAGAAAAASPMSVLASAARAVAGGGGTPDRGRGAGPVPTPGMTTATTGRRRRSRSRTPPTGRPAPLVLDPGAGGGSAAATSTDLESSVDRSVLSVVSDSSDGRGRGSGTAEVVKKIFLAASQRRRGGGQQQQQQYGSREASGGDEGSVTEAAATFARSAPKAGYLQKLGENIHQYKRRFFVLKPTTHLYYFVSPNDTEPRGCIDLESARATVRELETLPDGRFRFEILVHDDIGTTVVAAENNGAAGTEGRSDPDCGRGERRPARRIALEARSEDVGRAWMDSLATERLSYAKGEVDVLRRENSELNGQIAELERKMEDMRLVERDRDGAVQDAKEWREKFERLDGALRLLTRTISRPPDTGAGGKKANGVAKTGHDDGGSRGKSGEDGTTEENAGVATNEALKEVISAPTGQDSKSVAKLKKVKQGGVKERAQDSSGNMDRTEEKEDDVSSSSSTQRTFASMISEEEQLLEEINLSGTNFSALSNACQRLHESLRLTAIEADAAVEDLNTANEKVSALESRMSKAEKHLCKLWEENCVMREVLKKKKQERKVLVREVRKLLMVAAEEKQRHASQVDALRAAAVVRDRPCGKSVATGSPHDDPLLTNKRDANWKPQPRQPKEIGDEEKRLILELEEHVMSSLRLHEQFLAANGGNGSLAGPHGCSRGGSRPPSRNSNDGEGHRHPTPQNANGERRPSSRASSNVSSVTSSAATVRITNDNTNRGVHGGGTSKAAPSLDLSRPCGDVVLVAKGQSEQILGSDANSPLLPTRLSLIDFNSEGEEGNGSSVSLSDTASMNEQGGNLKRSECGTVVSTKLRESEGGKDEIVIDPPSRRASLSQEPTCGSDVRTVQSTQLSKGESQANPASHLDQAYVDQSMSQSSQDTSRKQNPFLKLDDDDNDKELVPPPGCASSSQSESAKSVVTDSGRATSRLTCPLADVVQTKDEGACGSSSSGEDGTIYHLTFYSQKIGLQFQKVENVPSSSGALAEAMTADVPGRTDGRDEAAELRQIADFSKLAKSHQGESSPDEQLETMCQVATPVDVVLVCGFHGFDDASNNVRPKIGARLVAFDGVSIETGKWTFAAVRKAIQTRGRPLTLSFRNDFLTMKQRSVLTRAVAEVGAALPPLQPSVQYKTTFPRKSQVVCTEGVARHCQPENHDRKSNGKLTPASSAHSSQVHVRPEQHCSLQHHLGHKTESADTPFQSTTAVDRGWSMRAGPNDPSFSEAGSSVFSSAVGPLMANLMSGISSQVDAQKHEPFVPEYLRRESDSLDSIPLHQSFKSSLL